MLRNRSLLHSGVRCLVPVLALALGTAAPALAAQKPDAGQIADSVKELKTVVPSKARVTFQVKQEEQEQKKAPEQQEGARIKVRAIHITGQTLYSEDKLQSLVQDAVDRELTADELRAVARRVARYFNEQGYIAASANVSPQDIKDGVVEIAVMPCQYGSIDLRNHSRLSDNTVNRYLSQIKTGDYVKKDVLERTLLLISDLGSISVNATLAVGKTNGTSQLIVEINDVSELTSQLSWDNYGNRFAGEDRANVSLNFNNLSGRGDTLSLGGNNSGGGMNNYYFGYQLPVGNRGAALGVSYSQLHYSLGDEFADLDASGSLKTTGIYAIYPLIRSRDHNLYAQIGYDHRKIEDRTGADASFTDKHTKVWTFGLTGDSRDKYGGGVSNYALALTTGRLAFDGGIDDSPGLNKAGTYTKVNLDFNRRQYFKTRLSYYLSLSGQLANKNLDSSEKIYLGGARGVRAYPQGEGAGDQGYLLTGELRWDLPKPNVQLAAFFDTGRVTINKNPLPDAGGNNKVLSGVGVGLIFNSRKDYAIRLDCARRTSSSQSAADTDKTRFWLKLTEYF